MSEHKSTLNLWQRLLNVQLAVGYVKKDVVVSGAKGVARDAVVAEIRQHLLANGIFASTTQVEGRYIETAQKSSSGTPLTIYVGKYVTRFVNIDLPGESVCIEHEAQGNDYGDKAPGKAATYAEKLNFVKGLLLETGISDEGRNPGEGDDKTPPAGAQDEKPSGVKTPQRKSEATKAPAGDPAPKRASAALVKQIVDLAEKTGKGEALAAFLKKNDVTSDTLTEGQAKALWTALNKPSEEREPGQEG